MSPQLYSSNQYLHLLMLDQLTNKINLLCGKPPHHSKTFSLRCSVMSCLCHAALILKNTSEVYLLLSTVHSLTFFHCLRMCIS